MRIAVAALLVVMAACARKSPEAPLPASGSAATVSADARSPARPALLHDHQQLITAVIADWNATAATLQLWQRDAGGAWQPDGPSWTGVIGKTGAGWGRGMHGDGAPAGLDGAPVLKAEGDLRSPAGAFELGGAFGYAANEVTQLPYARVTSTWRCVDDAASTRYNQVFDSAGVAVDWNSAEKMKRDDALYTLVIETKHNANAQAGAGSCIFLHVWRDAQSPTVGCTAMPQAQLRWLMGKIDPAQRPVFVLLPTATYAELARAWDLPALAVPNRSPP
jgi:D-alanyl-D-alanine dipeptidase